MSRIAAGILAVAAAVPLAQGQANKDILLKAESPPSGPYVFPMLVVILAALLLIASLVRRASR